MHNETIKIGKRGTVVIPASIRRSYKFEESSLVIAESRPDGVFLRPVVTLPLEIYAPERKAEFLLNNTITSDDYASAVKEVRKMGLDPETIPRKHQYAFFHALLLKIVFKIIFKPDPKLQFTAETLSPHRKNKNQ